MCECVFCRIIEKKAPAHIVCEKENLMAVLDIDPIHEGHVLILPKKHVDSIDLLSEEVLAETMALVQMLVKVLKNCYHADGYSIMQNGGKFCDFGHCHFHVFPRYQNDGFGWKYPEEKPGGKNRRNVRKRWQRRSEKGLPGEMDIDICRCFLV